MHRFLPLAVLPPLAVLLGFTPFTPVQNICPSCPKPTTDVVKLTSGGSIACKVLAQNDDYYVVGRLGELRAVMKSEISSIKWADQAQAAKVNTGGDQVLLKNGVVLHGSIVEQQPGRLLVIQVGGSPHVVWLSQVQRLHRAGRQQDLEAPPPPPAPSRAE